MIWWAGPGRAGPGTQALTLTRDYVDETTTLPAVIAPTEPTDVDLTMLMN